MAASCGSHDQKLLKSGRTKPEGPRPSHPMRLYSLNRSYCKSWVYAPVMEFTFLFYKITVRKARRRFITAERAPHLSSVILSGAKRSRRILAPHPRRGVPDDPCRMHRLSRQSRANAHRAHVGADIIRPRSVYQIRTPHFGESVPYESRWRHSKPIEQQRLNR